MYTITQRKLARAAELCNKRCEQRFARNVRLIDALLERNCRRYSEKYLARRYRYHWNEWGKSEDVSSVEVQHELKRACALAVRMREKHASKTEMDRISVYIRVLLMSNRFPIDCMQCAADVNVFSLLLMYNFREAVRDIWLDFGDDTGLHAMG